MDLPRSTRKYTQEEKQQLLANLDIEVAHRTRQFESWLADRLENFNMHQEGQVSRIPKQVRNMTMREFGDKYDGNIQAALRGFQKEKFVAASGGEGSLGELDKDARKRKWVASQEGATEGKDHEPKAPKNARLTNLATPKKAGSSTGPGTAQRARLLANGNKTPGTSRTIGRVPPSPSPQKQPRPPFGSNIGSSTYHPRQPLRPTSPAKPPSRTRVPSSSTFNPELPPKTPRYPSGGPPPPPATTLRLPRRDESMLSVNGSPLANPYEFGMGWLKGMEMAQADTDNEDGDDPDSTNVNGLAEPRTLKRAKSSIMIRRDPSVAFPQHLNGDGGLHSRTNSQASMFTAPSSQPSSSVHSRENSIQSYPQSQPTPRAQPMYPSQFPSSHSQPSSTTTPGPIRTHTRSFSALVAIPTKDGHLLEFDPLQTSPGALDALEGISDSAKKQARQEMSRLVQAAVDKWKIG